MKTPVITTRALLTAALLGGCVTKIPAHLRIEPSEGQSAEAVAVTDLQTAITAMLRRDPLARSPMLLDVAAVNEVSGGPPVAAWIRTVRSLERGEGHAERSLQQLEDQHPSTPVVALSRGYRLRMAENRLSSTETGVDEEAQQDVVALLTPLQPSATDETLPRPALDWLAHPDRSLAESVRAYGDRWVLTGWLHGPHIPLAALAPSLAAPMYDGLVRSPTGALVQARIEGRSAAVEPALADLKRATVLALTRAAADRDREQAHWAELKRETAEELKVEDPVAALLQRSRDALTNGAADDRAAGGALLAIGALRWLDACGEIPCVGMDRVETMRVSGRWGPELASLSAVWQVIALKEALDTMEVGHATVLYPKAIVSLVDALVGTGAGPLEIQLLRRRSPDPAVWLALGRAVGTEGLTDWNGARAALGAHLKRKTEEAMELPQDPEVVALLERISSRAIP